eukprot:TRINITY_DN12824_c0_g1_i1.p1 TRINITY_DN12824_c0_g1~~TRINITY_DN12824_c0_g1_i1.p1  ORF type:complete len:538 (+),score=74.28 TRINITY_DN12824_c0_g1_i1:176-1789(+)
MCIRDRVSTQSTWGKLEMGTCSSRRNCQHLKKIDLKNFREEYRARSLEEIKICQICQEKVDKSELSLCLICGFLHCVRRSFDPTHAAKHFVFNRSHFMSLTSSRHIFCHKCQQYIEPSTLDAACKMKHDEILYIFINTKHLSCLPIERPKHIQTDEEIVMEKASRNPGNNVDNKGHFKASFNSMDQNEILVQDIYMNEETKAGFKIDPKGEQMIESNKGYDSMKSKLMEEMQKELDKFEPNESPTAIQDPEIDISPERHSYIPGGFMDKIIEEDELPEERKSDVIYDSPKKQSQIIFRGTVVETPEEIAKMAMRHSLSPQETENPILQGEKIIRPRDPPPKILGLQFSSENGYLCAILQCLWASRGLVGAYLNIENTEWVTSLYNRQMQEYFLKYREETSPFDCSPYVKDALNRVSPNFVLHCPQDPTTALSLLFSSLLFTQINLLKERSGKKLISACDTLLGSFITSELYELSTCMSCKTVECTKQEKSIISIGSPNLSHIQQNPESLKYSLLRIEEKDYFAPHVLCVDTLSLIHI